MNIGKRSSFENYFHKKFDGIDLNFHMLHDQGVRMTPWHDVASFMQNAFKCTLQGSK